ncbi:MAG TPA: hypothetical protein VEK78_06520 [Gemmatimonadales bacterium]|nr:hypothetical protein [Gemmatimonadales bacterium]
MRCLAVVYCVAATSLDAQQPAPAPAESAQVESTARPAEPTLEQRHFFDAHRTAARGVAQLKDGVNRVTRTQATGDAAAQRRAGRLLAGLCGSARGFMARGRPRMDATAYADSSRLMARRLAAQIDSLIAYAPTCEQNAAATPAAAAAELGKRIKAYDTALNRFRASVGLPVRSDSTQTSRRP